MVNQGEPKKAPGGARPGSGRPATGHKNVMYRLPPTLIDAVREKAKSEGGSVSAQVQKALETYLASFE